MAVDEMRDEPLVDAAPHGLQTQALREVARADARGLEGLEDLEHRLGLRPAHLRRARRLRERYAQIAAPVEGADEEHGDGALPYYHILQNDNDKNNAEKKAGGKLIGKIDGEKLVDLISSGKVEEK